MGFNDVDRNAPNIVNTSVKRTRRYLTEKEVEKLIEAARKNGRYGHRAHCAACSASRRHRLTSSNPSAAAPWPPNPSGS